MKSKLKYRLEKFKRKYHYDPIHGTISIGNKPVVLEVCIYGVIPPTKHLRMVWNYSKRRNSIGIKSRPGFIVLVIPRMFFQFPSKHWDVILWHEIGHARLHMPIPIWKESKLALEVFSPDRFLRMYVSSNQSFFPDRQWMRGYQRRTMYRSIRKISNSDPVLIRNYERLLCEILYAVRICFTGKYDYWVKETEADLYAAMIVGISKVDASRRYTAKLTRGRRKGDTAFRGYRLRMIVLRHMITFNRIIEPVRSFYDNEK